MRRPPADRARRFADWTADVVTNDRARRHDAAIVEDDYDIVFRYAGRPVEPLQALDPTGQVIYVGSFSTILLPTLVTQRNSASRRPSAHPRRALSWR